MSSGGEEARQQMMNLKRTLQFDEPACLQFTSVSPITNHGSE